MSISKELRQNHDTEHNSSSLLKAAASPGTKDTFLPQEMFL